jgi:hypothetical protein
MSRLFKNIIRMSSIHDMLDRCPGVEVRVRVEDLNNIHEVMSLESGYPIYRPQSVYKQQEQVIMLADESTGFDNVDQLYHVRTDLLQSVMKDLILKHYQKRVSAVSEIFVIDWYFQRMTVVEISFGRGSTK